MNDWLAVAGIAGTLLGAAIGAGGTLIATRWQRDAQREVRYAQERADARRLLQPLVSVSFQLQDTAVLAHNLAHAQIAAVNELAQVSLTTARTELWAIDGGESVVFNFDFLRLSFVFSTPFREDGEVEKFSRLASDFRKGAEQVLAKVGQPRK